MSTFQCKNEEYLATIVLSCLITQWIFFSVSFLLELKEFRTSVMHSVRHLVSLVFGFMMFTGQNFQTQGLLYPRYEFKSISYLHSYSKKMKIFPLIRILCARTLYRNKCRNQNLLVNHLKLIVSGKKRFNQTILF